MCEIYEREGCREGKNTRTRTEVKFYKHLIGRLNDGQIIKRTIHARLHAKVYVKVFFFQKLASFNTYGAGGL